ncbi:hypothetical protein J4211_03040 [Candidatus Woesearchaeota archaeon]|nr:hypothetical protein [Candidatus Woesearchaeota archaeon]
MRPRKYLHGARNIQVTADIQLLNHLDELRVNRSQLFNDAMAAFIGNKESTIEEMQAEIEHLEKSILDLRGRKATKEMILKEKLRSTEEAKTLAEKQRAEKEARKQFCKKCVSKIEDDASCLKNQLCKACYWDSDELKRDLAAIRAEKSEKNAVQEEKNGSI